jgi:WD40 repeat protein
MLHAVPLSCLVCLLQLLTLFPFVSSDLAFSNPAEAGDAVMREYNERRASYMQTQRGEGNVDDVDARTTLLHGLVTRLRNGHSLGIYCCQWADDGVHLISCGHDGAVVLWNIESHSVVVSM